MSPHYLVGKQAPSFTLTNFNGEPYTFNPGSTGRPTALFFYPKSGSYGCTKEACQFKDALAESDVFKNTNVEVVGVSPDSVEKQKQFAEKHGLTYPVLSDDKGEARKLYHISRGLMGLTESGRVTFVIDSNGIVKDALDANLNFGSHSKFVTKWLTQLAGGEPTKTEGGDTMPTETAAAVAPTAGPGPEPTVEEEPTAPGIDSTPGPAMLGAK